MKLEEKEILNRSLAKLKEKFDLSDNQVRIEAYRRPLDLVINIMGVEFVCEIKGSVNVNNFNNVLRYIKENTKEESRPALLITKYINPSLFDKTFESKLNVLDCAGNCNIRAYIEDRILFHLSNKGEKDTTTKEKTHPAFQDAGIKVIFYFLQDDANVNNTYRIIQGNTGVSLGSIKNIIDELIVQKFVLTTKNGRFLKNKKKLIEQWVMSYNQLLKPKLIMGRMTFKDNVHKEKWLSMILPEGMCWGGESGAHMIDSYLEPGSFDIYTDIPTANLMRTGFVKPDDAGEIYIYQKFWKWNIDNCIVPKLLIYADLMGSGNSRCLEAAQRIAENGFDNIK